MPVTRRKSSTKRKVSSVKRKVSSVKRSVAVPVKRKAYSQAKKALIASAALAALGGATYGAYRYKNSVQGPQGNAYENIAYVKTSLSKKRDMIKEKLYKVLEMIRSRFRRNSVTKAQAEKEMEQEIKKASNASELAQYYSQREADF